MNIVKIHGASAFDLLNVVAKGNDPTAFLDYLSGLSVNALRVFGMWSQGFDPTRVSADTYRGLVSALAELVIGRGFYLQFTFGTDQQDGSPILMPFLTLVEFGHAAMDALDAHRDFVLWESANEFYKNMLQPLPDSLTSRLPLTSQSSYEDQALDYAGPFLAYGNFHSRRDWRSSADFKSALDLSRLNPPEICTHKPTLLNEPEQARRQTPRQYQDYFYGAELMSAGACLHDLDLEFCRIPTDANAIAAIDAAVEAWRPENAIDTSLSGRGGYTRGPQAECPFSHSDRYDGNGVEIDPTGAMRTYALDGTVILVDHDPARYAHGPQGGWKEVDRKGQWEQVRVCQR